MKKWKNYAGSINEEKRFPCPPAFQVDLELEIGVRETDEDEDEDDEYHGEILDDDDSDEEDEGPETTWAYQPCRWCDPDNGGFVCSLQLVAAGFNTIPDEHLCCRYCGGLFPDRGRPEQECTSCGVSSCHYMNPTCTASQLKPFAGSPPYSRGPPLMRHQHRYILTLMNVVTRKLLMSVRFIQMRPNTCGLCDTSGITTLSWKT